MCALWWQSVLNVFVWFVCDVLPDAVWIACLCCLCLYVFVCDLLCDVKSYACFLYWLCSRVCFLLCVCLCLIVIWFCGVVWCVVCVLCRCVLAHVCLCDLFVNSCVVSYGLLYVVCVCVYVCVNWFKCVCVVCL